MRWTTWLTLATILLPAALAGCIRSPVETPPEPPGCDGCGGDCCWDPPTVTPVPTSYPVAAHCFDCGEPCSCPPCPPNADCVACACSPATPPLLDAFEAKMIAECADCRAPAVAASRSGSVLYAATEEALYVLDPEPRRIGLPEPPIPAPDGWRYGAPSLHVDAQDRLWLATLAQSGALRVMMVARFDGRDLDEFVGVDLSHLPLLALVDRVHVSDVDGAPVAIAIASDDAWAFRSLDDGKSFGSPERLAPSGGSAVFGAPTQDPKGNLFIPFSFASTTIGVGPAPSSSLFYAMLSDARGAWSVQGGFAPGPQAPSRPSLLVSAGAIHFTYVDAMSTLALMEAWHSGASWSEPRPWSEPHEDVVGTAATAWRAASPRYGWETGMSPPPIETTAAWWDEGGALRVGRQAWGEIERLTIAQVEAPATDAAALALGANGRAVTAWIEEGGLWVGVERGAISACGPDAHCRGA